MLDDIKSDFAIYDYQPDLVYLDSSSTCLVPRIASEASKRFSDEIVASTRRGIHKLAVRGGEVVEECRQEVAKFLRTGPLQISFQKSIPSAICSIAYGYDWEHNEKDSIVVAQTEEHDVFASLLRTSEILGLNFQIIPINQDGIMDLNYADDIINDNTGIIAACDTIPGIGSRNPLKTISKLASKSDAILITDASRSMGFTDFRPEDLDADIIFYSGNLGLLGPPGLCMQWTCDSLNKDLSPGITGGTSVDNVQGRAFEFALPPDKFEPGIINIPAIAGLCASLQYLSSLGIESIRRKISALSRILGDGLDSIEQIQSYGPRVDYQTIFGFNLGQESSLNCHDIALFLDQSNIAVRSGLICSHPLIRPISEEGIVQVSFHVYNTNEDIQRLMETLQSIVKMI